MPPRTPLFPLRMMAVSGCLATLLIASCASMEATAANSDIGMPGPRFAVATSHDTLSRYDHDYYGRHHLVLTFFPAAFTPV